MLIFKDELVSLLWKQIHMQREITVKRKRVDSVAASSSGNTNRHKSGITQAEYDSG